MTSPGAVITAQPQVEMPSYGGLSRLMSKGTMSRYRVVADKQAGTLTWYSGDETPKVFSLPAPGGGPVAAEQGGRPVAAGIVMARFSRPGMIRREAFVMLVDPQGRCLARTFKYWSEDTGAQWGPAIPDLAAMGLRFHEEAANLRVLNKQHPHCSRWWMLQTPGWILLPILLAAIVIMAIGVVLISAFDHESSSTAPAPVHAAAAPAHAAAAPGVASRLAT